MPGPAAVEPLGHRRALRAQEQERQVGQARGRRRDVGAADPDRLGAELRPERRLQRRRPALGRDLREPPAEILGAGAEGVVEGIEPPDRPADLGAEHPERLGLGAELGGIADHLVADEARGDQVGQRGRARTGGFGYPRAGPRQARGGSCGLNVR